jgi:hypothetical protein
MNELASHADHNFESLTLFKANRMPGMITAYKAHIQTVQRELARVGALIRKEYD